MQLQAARYCLLVSLLLVVASQGATFEKKRCTACQGGIPPLLIAEARNRLPALWSLVQTPRHGVYTGLPEPALTAEEKAAEPVGFTTPHSIARAEETYPDENLWTFKLARRFNVRNFAEAIAFTNRIAELAEFEGHHPDVITGYGYVEVALYTHKIHGLHENDFIMATAIDELWQEQQKARLREAGLRTRSCNETPKELLYVDVCGQGTIA